MTSHIGGFTLVALGYFEQEYVGMFDANNYWAKVFDRYGSLVEELQTDVVCVGGDYYQPNFTEADFLAEGYLLQTNAVRVETEDDADLVF